MFKKATKEQSKLRMAISGPAGSGKTYSALSIAKHLGQRIALVDTEVGSASKYSDAFDFDVVEYSKPYHPNRLVEAIASAETSGYDVLIIDSLTHFWNEPGGFLDLVEDETKKMRAKGGQANNFVAWKSVDPIYRRLIGAILQSKMHVICTMRAKTEYENTKDANGKSQIRKIGLEPVFRKEAAYEFDIEGLINDEHILVIGKTRCAALDGKVFEKPGKDFGEIVNQWLSSGVPASDGAKPIEIHAVLEGHISSASSIGDLASLKPEILAAKATLSESEYAHVLDAYRERHAVLNAQTSNDQ